MKFPFSLAIPLLLLVPTNARVSYPRTLSDSSCVEPPCLLPTLDEKAPDSSFLSPALKPRGGGVATLGGDPPPDPPPWNPPKSHFDSGTGTLYYSFADLQGTAENKLEAGMQNKGLRFNANKGKNKLNRDAAMDGWPKIKGLVRDEAWPASTTSGGGGTKARQQHVMYTKKKEGSREGGMLSAAKAWYKSHKGQPVKVRIVDQKYRNPSLLPNANFDKNLRRPTAKKHPYSGGGYEGKIPLPQVQKPKPDELKRKLLEAKPKQQADSMKTKIGAGKNPKFESFMAKKQSTKQQQKDKQQAKPLKTQKQAAGKKGTLRGKEPKVSMNMDKGRKAANPSKAQKGTQAKPQQQQRPKSSKGIKGKNLKGKDTNVAGKDQKGKNAKPGKNLKGKDAAKGKALDGKHPKAKDAKGKSLDHKNAKGKNTKGKDAKGKNVKGKDSKSKAQKGKDTK